VHLGQQQKAAKTISRRAAAKAAVHPGQQKKAAKEISRARNKTPWTGFVLNNLRFLNRLFNFGHKYQTLT
jgi:hypothetical protein